MVGRNVGGKVVLIRMIKFGCKQYKAIPDVYINIVRIIVCIYIYMHIDYIQTMFYTHTCVCINVYTYT